MKYLLFLSVFLFSITVCGQKHVQLEKLALDDSLSLAIFHPTKMDSLLSTSKLKHAEKTYAVVLNDSSSSDSSKYIFIDEQGKNYKTYISSLPLIQIEITQEIVNEPKRMARLKYSDSDTTFTAFVGIELRGSSSLVFPKKTYDLNFYTDSLGTANLDLRLGGMRKDDDWILDGLYNEPLRMRSYLALNLWTAIHKPYYLDREPKAKSGVSGTYAELFLNGRYQGVFLLQEQLDRKLTRIQKMEEKVIRGELFQGARYHGAVTFDSLVEKKNYMPSWGGYDIKYPRPTNFYWDNVYPFTDFVIHSSEEAFAKAISSKFQLDNAIDYFLFINALRAPDNLGKNLYLIRYDEGEPYFYAPWDLDGSFGTIYSGKRIPTTNDFLSNGLLRRLLKTNAADFVTRFQQRWKELRRGILATDTLLERQRLIYQKMLNEGIFEREAMVWENFNYEYEGLEYMQQWTRDRLAFLDNYIASISIKKL